MDCPKCREPMFVMEYEHVEMDVCPECGGVWLDGGELAAILGADHWRDKTDKPPRIPKDEKLLDCPVCVSKLVKGPYGSSGVIVDRCPHGDGVFLDQGELEQIQAYYAQRAETDSHVEDAAGRLLTRALPSNKPPRDAS